MANIRMLDGTVIRGVPDGVSKDDFNAQLIKRFGQDRFNKMTGSTRAALSQPVEKTAHRSEEIPLQETDPETTESSVTPTSRASAFLHNITKTEGRTPTREETDEAVRMRRDDAGLSESPESEGRFNSPYQEPFSGRTSDEGARMNRGRSEEGAPVSLTGKAGEEAARLRQEFDDSQQVTPETEQRREGIRNEFLMAAERGAIGEKSYAQKEAAGMYMSSEYESQGKDMSVTAAGEVGKKVIDLIETGEYSAADIGIPQAMYDSLSAPKDDEDRSENTPEEMLHNKRKAAYYAVAASDPQMAEKLYPDMREKIDRKAADEKAAAGAAARESGRDETGGWGKLFSVTWGGSPKAWWNGIKMRQNAGVRTIEEHESIGQFILQNAMLEYPTLQPEAKQQLKEAASRRDMSVSEYMQSTADQFNSALEKEAGNIGSAKERQKEILQATPVSADTTLTGHIASLLISNSPQMVYIATGMITRSPAIMMTAFGTDIYGNEYQARRVQGRTHEQAEMDTYASMAIEALSEGIPVSRAIALMKKGKRSVAGRGAEAFINEALQEEAAEVLNIAYDIGVVKEDMTLGEAWLRMRDAAIVGGAMGIVVSTPVLAFSDNNMTNANDAVKDAKEKLKRVAALAMDPSNRVKKEDVQEARAEYAAAFKARSEMILEKERIRLEKKQAKQDKKEAKRKGKLSPNELKREDAVEAAEKADQSVTGPITNEDLEMADVLEKGGNAELEAEDGPAVQKALDAGYMQITKAGTPVVLPAGQRRLKAVRDAEAGVTNGQADEVIEPVPFERSETADDATAKQAIDDEIGQRIRGEFPEQKIEPKPFTSRENRKAKLTARVDSKVKDTKVREKIADAIIKAEEVEQAYNERNEQQASSTERQRDGDYQKALDEVTDVELEVANNLAILDEKSVSGYPGTKLGAVLKNASNVLKAAEERATKELKDQFWNKPTQGQLFDITGVLVRGTAMYANVVKVGALKIAKHGLNYSAWVADMVGEFGESIRPALAKVFHDAKRSVSQTIKLSHEKFLSGDRKGQLKHSPNQYAKPGAIRRLRQTLKKLAKEGEGGRFWYEKSGKEILRISGGDKKIARQIAGLIAIYSKGTAVSANLTNALKMWSQWNAGKVDIPERGTLAGRFSADDRLAIEWLNGDLGRGVGRQVFAGQTVSGKKVGNANPEDVFAIGDEFDGDYTLHGIRVASIDQFDNDVAGLMSDPTEKKAVQALVRKIRKSGRIDAVTAIEDGSGALKLVEGAHRVEAARILGMKNIPVVVATESDAGAQATEVEREFGSKRYPFFINIMREIDPESFDKSQGVTVDLWMMRAFGYDKGAPTDAEGAFIATEIHTLANKFGWEPQQMQAAIWVAIKARWESIQKDAKSKSVSLGLATWKTSNKGAPIFEVVGETREDKIKNEKKIILVFRKAALAAINIEKKLEQSKADFADNISNHHATISWEAEPSTKLGTNLNALSLEDKVMLQMEIAEILTNPETGREFIAEWLGLLGANQFIGPGSWDMSVGSTVQNSVLVPVRHGAVGAAESQAESVSAMNGYAAIIGFLLKQDAVAWHKPFYSKSLKDSNGVEIRTTRTLTHKQTLKLYEAIVELTNDIGHAPIIMDGVVRVLNFSDMPNREFHKLIAEAADNAGIGGAIEVFQSDGDIIQNDWIENKKGQQYVDQINNSENPNVQQAFTRAKRKFARAISEVYEKYSSQEANARIRTVKLEAGTKLGRVPKGHLRFRVFRKGNYTSLDVTKAGQGLKGAEQKRGAMKVISAYPNKGFKKEPGLGKHEYVIDVPKTKLYDIGKDSLNLKERSQVPSGSFKLDANGRQIPLSTSLDQNKLEQLIKDEGFAGYYTPDGVGNLKGQARFFYSLNVSTPEVKGTAVTSTFSVSDRIRVEVVENEFDEFEVREANGEVYYATDADDAIRTARSINGPDSTVVIIDQYGDVITTDVVSTKPKPIKLTGFGIVKDPDSVASVEEFISEWVELTTQNPITAERIVGDYAAVELRPQAGEIWLDSIRSFEKTTGNGSRALKLIIDLADQHGVTLRMTAKPFSTNGNELEYNDLVSWYERNGFIKERTEEGYDPSSTMIRTPRNVGVQTTFGLIKRPSRPTNEGYGLDIEVAQTLADKHFNQFYGDVNFEIVNSVEQLPDDMYDEIAFFGLGDGVKGVFRDDPINGPTIYIVTNNLYVREMKNYGEPDIDGFLEVVLHEMVGHFGLQALLGKSYNKVMDAIRRDMSDEVNRRGINMGTGSFGRRLAAEEVVAYIAQDLLNGRKLKKNQLNVIERVINAIKVWLASVGIRKMTHDDIANLVLRASTYVKNNNQAKLAKRVRIVTKMKEAQKVIDRAAGEMGIEKVDVESSFSLSLGMKQARKDDPALDRFMNKIGHNNISRAVKLRDWWELRRQNFKREFEISMLDQFAGIKHMERELKILGPESGYMSVRLTAGTDVIIRSAIENAVPIWNEDGSVMMDTSTEGLLEVLAPVSQNADMLKAFEAFIVARRARRLKKEGREHLLDREEIGAALKFIRKNKLHKVFNQTAKDLAEYKSKVLDFAQEAGLIDPVTRKMWEHHDHVPFYRVLADNNRKGGPFAGSAVGRVGKVIHRLKGGTDVLKNPLESIVQNLSMLIEASVKNRATADVVNNFMGTGVVTKAPQAEMTTALVPMKQVKEMLFENGVSLDSVGQELLEGIQKLTALQAPTAENIISVQEDGKKQYYYVHDAGVMRGLDNVSPTQWIALMKILRFPKRFITRSITLMPDFILKNWFRDIFHTYMLHRHGTIIPVVDSGRGWAKAIAQDGTYKDILSGGGMFDSGYVNASDPEKQNIAIRKGLLGKGRHNILDTPKKLRDFYMRIANGAENAHRIVVYQKTLKETGSRKQALFEARDLMDFSMRGANPVIRFLTETVPFWGARVQGISRTGKGFTESPVLTLMRAVPIVLASIALYAYNRDDDRFKDLNAYEKRMYYHFYDVFEDGDHYRLPRPFEVGAIFSTMPEIMAEYTMSNEPDRGEAASLAIWWTITEMLNLAPDVQAISPALELMMNKNSFTEAPIVSEWDKQLDPREQVGPRTDKSIKWMAEHMPDGAPDWARSPKKLEHLARGYIGSALDYTLAASNYVFDKQVNGDVAQPSLRWDETPFAKSFKREEYGKYGTYLNSMYEVIEEADKIYNSINKVRKEPRSDDRDARLEELRTENEALLYARGKTKGAAKAVASYNKQIRRVYADRKMTPAEKREKIDALYRKQSEAAKKVYDYRPGGKLNKYDGESGVTSRLDQIKQLFEGLTEKPKPEQVDELISAQLPHTATLVNDINISDEELRKLI